MFNLLSLLLVTLFFSSKTYTHNSKEAFFTMETQNNQIYVLAEFPWTIRKALLQFDPKLAETKNKEDFDKALFLYVKTNFLLKNQEGFEIQLVKIKELDLREHSHQSNFEFYFDGPEFREVQNTLLFNLSSEHKNYHTILLKGKTIKKTTLYKASSFFVN